MKFGDVAWMDFVILVFINYISVFNCYWNDRVHIF